ncbi:hypothetical protein DUNSADRAFT_15758 [Dunaliella salina]|uniref:Encoded protein n=1 Tax=Dunaliella salina TaxID=3046 RepID=A0ABQ7H9D7_DUNSA|nr:hypothetical protein DUNSADRAFT_15758 [Dunaliella salina]|eukprot:KAF5843463.1 hypothetical protein DUNSADRAFT_15758 [Dunaliella salina]
MPKAPKPYHINKQCNKWEEENHLKQMEKKINNAKPTIPLAARAPPNVPRKKFPKPGLQPSTANTPRAQTADTHNNYYGCPLGHQVQLDMAHLDGGYHLHLNVGSQPSSANTPRAQTADTHNNYYGCPLGHQVQLDLAHLDDLISRRLMELLKQPVVQQSIQKDASVVQAKQQQEQLRRLAEAARRVTKPSSAPLPGQVGDFFARKHANIQV